MTLTKQIPNLITMVNLLCGCIAVFYAAHGAIENAAIFMALGIFFDFFDGLAARVLNAQSQLGLELDSLADAVTSGLVPGMVMYQLFSNALNVDLLNTDMQWVTGITKWAIAHPLVPVIGFFITLASVYRLAKFNLDTRQSESFIGVPTPANAILIVSLALIAQYNSYGWASELLHNPYVLIGITLFSCWVMNSEIRLFAFKFKSFGWKGNEVRWLFVVASLALGIWLKIGAVPIVIIGYIFISLVTQKQSKVSITQ